MEQASILLSSLHTGDTAIILELENSALGIKLMEMGCLPGIKILVDNIAPLGDPLSIRIGNYILGLRKTEAAAIKVLKQ